MSGLAGAALPVLAALGLWTGAASAGGWIADKADLEAVNAVWVHIGHKECGGAVRTLNEGMAKNHPSVLLLAGAMFETGTCLKPNWDRAVDHYQRADAAGHPQAAAKLASGYAASVGGPDRAAAMWWALRAGTPLPTECQSVKALVDDAGAFVQALQGWPAGRLDNCAYVAGVMATIAGDLEFSARAAAHGLRGQLRVGFTPARQQVDIATEELEFVTIGGIVNGDAMDINRNSRSLRLEFERDLRKSAELALRRYVGPPAIAPDWNVSTTFLFEYVIR